MREQLQPLLATHRARRPATHVQLVRERLIDGVRPVRSLLSALVWLLWQATDAHPVLAAQRTLFCVPEPTITDAGRERRFLTV